LDCRVKPGKNHHRFSLYLQKMPQGMFELFERDVGVQARSVRSVIQNTEHRKRVGVLDAAGKVSFASYSEDELRALLHHDPAGNGTACGDCHVNAIGFGKSQQPGDRAEATSFAVVDIVSESNRASAGLQAVRQKK
jgi:hypothetical protein